ncbi:MAG: radical SAM protein [Candidatus Omnitrophota bacterium]
MTKNFRKNILLINPRVIRYRSYPSVALASIGSYLRSNGCNVRIVDSNFTNEDPYRVLAKTNGEYLVGISCESKNIEEALKIAVYAKEKQNIVVMGGLHVSLAKEKILDNICVDYGIYGDGELSLLKLIEALDEGLPLEDVPGLIYKFTGQIKVNEKGQAANLDELPFPDYKLAGINRISQYPLITSRDCPYKCTYCTVGAISHGSWRIRSPKNVIAELKYAKETYNIKSFIIFDENFSHDMERVKMFCLMLLKENLILPWAVIEGMRADKVDREFLRLLKVSGCKDIIYGVESADEKVFENISKGGKFLTIEKAIDLAKDEGLEVGAYFVIGLPGATFESEMKSIEFATKHNLSPCVFWMAIPYYNTQLYEWVLKNAKLLREPTGENLVNSLSTEPFFETEIFPKDKVKKAFVMAQLSIGNYSFYEDHDGKKISKIFRFLLVCLYMLRYDLCSLWSFLASGRRLKQESFAYGK